MKPQLLSCLLLLAACGGDAPAPAAQQEPATEEATAEPAAPASSDVAHGREVVSASCTSCHGTEVFTREDRKVKSAEALDAQVEMCGMAAHLSEEDQQAASAYLESEYYSFE